MGRNKMLLFALQWAPSSPSAVTWPLSQDTEVHETTEHSESNSFIVLALVGPTHWNFDEAKAKK